MIDETSAALVSVVIPCFNQGRFLADALDSVLAQTHQSWEVVVVDDGSTDETEVVSRHYVARDKRIRYVWQSNRGLSSARNTGLRNSRGSHLQFLDADDVIASEKFERQLSALASLGQHAICISDFRWASGPRASIIHDKNWLCDPSFRTNDPQLEMIGRWGIDLAIPIHCALFTSAVFGVDSAFDEDLVAHEDWDFWIRLLGRTIEVCYVRAPLAIYRNHEGSMSRDPRRMWIGFKQVYDKHLARLSDREGHLEALKGRRHRAARDHKRKLLKYLVARSVPTLVDFYKRRAPSRLQTSIRRFL